MAKAHSTAEESALGNRNLETALKQIERDFGTGTIMRLGDRTAARVPVVSTGALALDLALGIGGVPRGRIVEIYGPESSGKTTVCLQAVAMAQKGGGIAAFIDTEHALDPQWARTIGVDVPNLLVSQPDCGEDALNIADTLVRSNAIDVLVVDSVAALVPRAEIEGQMGDSYVGVQARLMSQAMRKLTGVISKSKTSLIFTNQIREKIGVMFGNPETTPGGHALKFYASVRMDIRRIETIKNTLGEAIGNRVRVKVVKNKLAAPFKLAEFDIMYDEGVSQSGSILDVGVTMKVIEKRGAWFSYGTEQIGQGREQAKSAIRENPELAQRLLTDIFAQALPKAKADEAPAEVVAEPEEAPAESTEPEA